MTYTQTRPNLTEGASAVGWHFLLDWLHCPFRWYLKNLKPHNSGVGLARPKSSMPIPLGIGLGTHIALEAWYRSGWQRGDYSFDTAMDTLVEWARGEDLGDTTEEIIRSSGTLLRDYHRALGPQSNTPEFPDVIRVAENPLTHEPMLEETFEVDLGYRGYTFTSRLDLVSSAHPFDEPCLRPVDHKTTALGRLSAERRGYLRDGQISGQKLVLEAAFGSTHTILNPQVNAILKSPSVKGVSVAPRPPRALESFERTPTELEKFRHDVIRMLKQIDQGVEDYHELQSQGVPEHHAALLSFNGTPPHGECGGYAGTGSCAFLHVCAQRHDPDPILADFETRFELEESTTT